MIRAAEDQIIEPNELKVVKVLMARMVEAPIEVKELWVEPTGLQSHGVLTVAEGPVQRAPSFMVRVINRWSGDNRG